MNQLVRKNFRMTLIKPIQLPKLDFGGEVNIIMIGNEQEN